MHKCTIEASTSQRWNRINLQMGMSGSWIFLTFFSLLYLLFPLHDGHFAFIYGSNLENSYGDNDSLSHLELHIPQFYRNLHISCRKQDPSLNSDLSISLPLSKNKSISPSGFSKMRDFASCFSEHAIKVSDSSCSGSNQVPSTQNIVSYLYKTKLSTQKELLIVVTWCKNLMGQGLSVNIDDDPSCICKVDTNSWPFTKKKGTRSFESGKSKINIFWDVSSARFESGPEPSDGFYVVVVIDSELGLLLGDMGEEAAIKKFNTNAQIANFYLVARKEHVLGKTLYSTKARFCDHGIDHDILIKCRGENGGLKDSELSISIDRRRVIHVKNLQWKFRGNQTLFIDGLPVDMMWDVHDWFFNSSASGYGVFMFRTRSGLESRLWLEEIMQQKEEKVGFSLLIYACKSP